MIRSRLTSLACDVWKRDSSEIIRAVRLGESVDSDGWSDNFDDLRCLEAVCAQLWALQKGAAKGLC